MLNTLNHLFSTNRRWNEWNQNLSYFPYCVSNSESTRLSRHLRYHPARSVVGVGPSALCVPTWSSARLAEPPTYTTRNKHQNDSHRHQPQIASLESKQRSTKRSTLKCVGHFAINVSAPDGAVIWQDDPRWSKMTEQISKPDGQTRSHNIDTPTNRAVGRCTETRKT